MIEPADKKVVASSESTEGLFALKERMDPLLNSEIRFYIMTALAFYKTLDFSFLKENLEATDGNLSINLSKLEAAGFLTSHKEFVRKKPRTSYTITPLGLEKLSSYLDAVAEVRHRIQVDAKRGEKL